jgi:uncharacterized damage-inducible protein DinB
MAQSTLEDQLLDTWNRHNEILLFLIDKTPAGGAAAVPSQSRGRTVAEQFAHLDRVRKAWVGYHTTGKRPRLPKTVKGAPPSLSALRKQLEESGEDVHRLLSHSLRGEAKIRMFGQSPVRWQIMLALKQSGLRLPEAVAVKGLWGKWIMGK